MDNSDKCEHEWKFVDTIQIWRRESCHPSGDHLKGRGSKFKCIKCPEVGVSTIYYNPKGDSEDYLNAVIKSLCVVDPKDRNLDDYRE